MVFFIIVECETGMNCPELTPLETKLIIAVVHSKNPALVLVNDMYNWSRAQSMSWTFRISLRMMLIVSLFFLNI